MGACRMSESSMAGLIKQTSTDDASNASPNILGKHVDDSYFDGQSICLPQHPEENSCRVVHTSTELSAVRHAHEQRQREVYIKQEDLDCLSLGLSLSVEQAEVEERKEQGTEELEEGNDEYVEVFIDYSWQKYVHV